MICIITVLVIVYIVNHTYPAKEQLMVVHHTNCFDGGGGVEG